MNRSWSDVQSTDEALAAVTAHEHAAMVEQDEAFCDALNEAIAAGKEQPPRGFIPKKVNLK
jgi:hypothetical protein